jgi:hypothetical protein
MEKVDAELLNLTRGHGDSDGDIDGNGRDLATARDLHPTQSPAKLRAHNNTKNNDENNSNIRRRAHASPLRRTPDKQAMLHMLHRAWEEEEEESEQGGREASTLGSGASTLSKAEIMTREDLADLLAEDGWLAAHTHTHTCTHTHTHTHRNKMHTYTHTYTHTHAHT